MVRSKAKFKKPISNIVDISGKPFNIDNLAYQASGSGRLSTGLDAPTLSPTSAGVAENATLINRSQAMMRNNSWLHKGVKSDVANEIGNGIKPVPNSSNKQFNSDILSLWNSSVSELDADGIYNIYGMQMLAAKARREQGECFIRIRPRRPQDGLTVPVQFQLLEPVFCPYDLDKILPNGNKVISGVELNKIGKRVAYWMYNYHPNTFSPFESLQMVRVPAEQIIHYYKPERIGALRASPEISRAITKAHMLDKFDNAELTRKETRANFTGVITKPEYTDEDYLYDPMTGEDISEDHADVGMMDMEPGTFPSLLAGEDIKLFGGDSDGDNYIPFSRQQLMGIAAAIGVPYQVATGDYSGLNDRLARVILNQYHREIEQIQNLVTIHQFCRVIWNTYVDTAVLSGAVSATGFENDRNDYIKCDHISDAFPYIQPEQDINAQIKAIDAGLDSRKATVKRRNKDVEVIDNQRAEDMKRELMLELSKNQDEISIAVLEKLTDMLPEQPEQSQSNENENE